MQDFMKVLLFQIRNADDPMLGQEFRCFDNKFDRLRGKHPVEVVSHNIIAEPKGYETKWKGFDAIMVGGSGDYGCVNNRSDWFLRFCDQLRTLVEKDMPLFCSCFGHQALATALGGEVKTDRSRAELGTREVELNEAGKRDPLLGELTSPFSAQFGHNDFVSRLPEDAINLASTDLCEVQSYTLKNRLVYATQFHPELSGQENQERAQGYLRVYDPEMTTPEKLAKLFRDSSSASDLLPRFLILSRS